MSFAMSGCLAAMPGFPEKREKLRYRGDSGGKFSENPGNQKMAGTGRDR
jgi:hypothetical protein